MHYTSKKKSKHAYKTEPISKKDPNKPKILKKNYHVTSQTANHIATLAIKEDTSEGRIVDKIVRTYMAWIRDPNNSEHPYSDNLRK